MGGIDVPMPKEVRAEGPNPTTLPYLNIVVGDDGIPIRERNHPAMEKFVL